MASNNNTTAATAAAAATTPEGLTSTTAPGKAFASRKELADHYKSDWHRYNLKRREAGLPLLLEADFQARLAAAMSLRQDNDNVRNGTSHLKKGKKHNNANNNNKKQQSNKRKEQEEDGGGGGSVTLKAQASAYESRNENNHEEAMDTEEPVAEQPEKEEEEEDEHVVIDPKQCLFDHHFSATVQANVDRMYRKYGFFLPDREYLTDMEGLVGYCHEKIKLGHMCLYCHKVFPTWQGCQKHMISKRHTKLKYEAGIDLEDLTLFYDFTEADTEFLTSVGITAPAATAATAPRSSNNDQNAMETEDDGEAVEDDGNDEDWEDISDDEDMAEGGDAEDEDDDDGLYDAYEEQLAQYGFDVNTLGELVLPNGRVIGHRALSRYYRQRAPQNNSPSTAVVAARRAAGERLFNGQVYNIHGSEENALALAKAGIQPTQAAGRATKGILVKGEGGMYTSFSIYRYRAAMRKQRRDDFKGKRIEEKTKQNINRMDKKANRLMNGVSVAHAAR